MSTKDQPSTTDRQPVSDEEMQAIDAVFYGDKHNIERIERIRTVEPQFREFLLSDNSYRRCYEMHISLQAIHERNATIAELRERESALDVELARANCIIDQLRTELTQWTETYARASASLDEREKIIEAQRRELAELRDRIEDELGCKLDPGDSVQNIKSLISAHHERVEKLEAEIAELRKPVAVDPVSLANANGDAEDCRLLLADPKWQPQRYNVFRLLSAYDTLAQNAARDASARDALMAEIRGLRVRLASAFDELSLRETRLIEGQERERQLREGIGKSRAIPVTERLPTHIYTVFIYVIDDPLDHSYWDVGIYNQRRGKWQCSDGDDDRDVEVSHWIDQPDDPRTALAQPQDTDAFGVSESDSAAVDALIRRRVGKLEIHPLAQPDGEKPQEQKEHRCGVRGFADSGDDCEGCKQGSGNV